MPKNKIDAARFTELCQRRDEAKAAYDKVNAVVASALARLKEARRNLEMYIDKCSGEHIEF